MATRVLPGGNEGAGVVQVAERLSAAGLQAGWRGSKDATLAQRYQAIWLLAEGHTAAEVARLTGFVRRWVEELMVRYNRIGPSSLGDRCRGNGAKLRILTPEILATVRKRLQKMRSMAKGVGGVGG